jgi:hypothetical protein
MDNNKLIHILQRDIGELDELIREIRQTGRYDALDMEFLQTRISGIRHILEIAGDVKQPEREITPGPEKPKPVSVALPEKKVQPVKPLLRDKQVMKEVVSVAPPKETIATHTEAPIPVPQPVEETVAENISAMYTQEMGLEEETFHPSEKQTLAEKFVAGKSLNDLLFEKSKNDLKFSHMPLSSLANAIGTNERFLFTRELFEGDMESFTETLQKLDTMNNIQEAAEYLRENFKWKKSETSLWFIDLVKRRFTI